WSARPRTVTCGSTSSPSTPISTAPSRSSTSRRCADGPRTHPLGQPLRPRRHPRGGRGRRLPGAARVLRGRDARPLHAHGPSPAGRPKHVSGVDLVFAMSLLYAQGFRRTHVPPDLLLLGELGLDGRVRPIPGVLPALLAARAHGLTRAVVPE